MKKILFPIIAVIFSCLPYQAFAASDCNQSCEESDIGLVRVLTDKDEYSLKEDKYANISLAYVYNTIASSVHICILGPTGFTRDFTGFGSNATEYKWDFKDEKGWLVAPGEYRIIAKVRMRDKRTFCNDAYIQLK